MTILNGICLFSDLKMALLDKNGLLYLLISRFGPFSNKKVAWNIEIGHFRPKLHLLKLKTRLWDHKQNIFPTKSLKTAEQKILSLFCMIYIGLRLGHNWFDTTKYGLIIHENSTEYRTEWKRTVYVHNRALARGSHFRA